MSQIPSAGENQKSAAALVWGEEIWHGDDMLLAGEGGRGKTEQDGKKERYRDERPDKEIQ